MSKQWAWQPITWTHTYTDPAGWVRLDCDADRITALVDGIDDRDFSFAHDEDVRLCRRVPAQGVPVEVWHTLHAALEEYRDDAQRCFCPCSECVAERDEANSALTWLDSQRSQGQEE